MFFENRADSTNKTGPRKPVVVSPSGSFDGNDGKWSTFFINIGGDGESLPGQNFRVLISTSSPLTIVPEEESWCDEECAKKRGIEPFNGEQLLGFDSSKSHTWREQGIYDVSSALPKWWTGTTKDATWGTDNVGLGASGPSSDILTSQWVVKYPFDDLYLGSFGLAPGSVNIGGDQQWPFLTNLAGFRTPSTSYGYTAGAMYRNNGNGVQGNLVLGGFDQSRLSQVGTSIAMPSILNTSLVVGVQSIIYKVGGSNPESLTADRASGVLRFSATIDSTLPYLWLPDDICDQLADKFQLSFDNSSELYTVNSTAHDYNKQQNASVSFKIGDSPQDSLEATTITLPYDAFLLQASSPLFPNGTDYFPIRKSKKGIFMLGRTFLQEAYIVVDYGRSNFTVAPAVFSDPLPQESIVPIYTKDDSVNMPPPTVIPGNPDKKGGLAPGAVAGIVVGIVILLLLLGLGAFFFWKRRHAAQTKDERQETSEFDAAFPETEVKQPRMSELDSDPRGKPPGGYYGAGGRDSKAIMAFPPVSEMESPPAEMYSPPQEIAQLSGTPTSERKGLDYFTKSRRRGATRESSGNNTPSTPGTTSLHELPGDYGQYQISGVHFDSPPPGGPLHSRGPSGTSLSTNIDGVISGQQRPEAGVDGQVAGPERRPSHARGASDTTIQSDTTAVSQPTPEEIEIWASSGTVGPRRPLSD